MATTYPPVSRETGPGGGAGPVSNGGNAWELIQADDFGMIFAGLQMPGLDGQRLYRLAIESCPEQALQHRVGPAGPAGYGPGRSPGEA